MRIAEYIWIGGNGELRSKTRMISDTGQPPEWGFDGSSTEQATGEASDCILKPVRCRKDPMRGGAGTLVLCEVYDSEGNPDKNNYRAKALEIYKECKDKHPVFGIEQEYTLQRGCEYLGWLDNNVPDQGPFYCGVGDGKEYGADVAETHMLGCLAAEIKWCGKNAEVMPGQWEFQVGPSTPIELADELWLARYILLKVAARRGYKVSFEAKPHPKLNGAGAHTNFSTSLTRGKEGLMHCFQAAESLGLKVIKEKDCGIEEGNVYSTKEFPAEYGSGYKDRLTGEHETCSFSEFKVGVADRTASIRIPLHVEQKGAGYIEDRRPCANADPYRVVTYIMETVCG